MKQGWQIKRLGEICDILNGFAFKSNEYVKEGVRVIRITNVQKGKIVDEEPKYFPVKRSNEILKYILQDGDLLMSLTGNVGRVGIIPSSLLPAALNQRVACLRIKDKTISIKYLFHLLNSNLFEKDCISSASGIAQLNMSTKWLEQYEMVIPPPSEQQRIVNLLDAECAKIDALKANAEKNLQNAKDLFQAALKKELEPKEGWETMKLGEVCESRLGKTLNSSTDTGELRPYLCAVNVQWDRFDLSYVKEARFNNDEIKKYTAQKGDLLVCEGGETGRAAIWDKDETIQYQNALHRIRFKDNTIIPRFCLYYLRFLKFSGVLDKEYSHGATILHLVTKSLYSIPIPVPTISEQQRMIARLDALNEKCKTLQANYEKTLSLCDDLKQALLRKAFNGEI